jgi:hypothetical protein
VGRAEGVTVDVASDEARDPIVVPSPTEEESSAAARGGSPTPMKERRTKAAGTRLVPAILLLRLEGRLRRRR